MPSIQLLMTHSLDDPRDQIQQLAAEARRAFASDVDGLLTELKIFSQSLGDAVGEVGREEALRALRRFVLEKFDQRLQLRSAVDPLLLQLVKDAHDFLNDPDSQVDKNAWNREAKKLLRDHAGR
jgi:hypothetical protein